MDAITGEAKRGREANDAASYDDNGYFRFSRHDGYVIDIKGRKKEQDFLYTFAPQVDGSGHRFFTEVRKCL